MKASNGKRFERDYALHLQHLKLKGLQPKTIEAYSRAIRRIGERFDGQIDNLSEQQLTDYFCELVTSHSWSTVMYPDIDEKIKPIVHICCETLLQYRY